MEVSEKVETNPSVSRNDTRSRENARIAEKEKNTDINRKVIDVAQKNYVKNIQR